MAFVIGTKQTSIAAARAVSADRALASMAFVMEMKQMWIAVVPATHVARGTFAEARLIASLV